MKAGKHVLVEKSLGINVQEVKEMLVVSEEEKVCIWEDFMFVYHSQHEFVKKQISTGELGDIRCVRASFGFPPFSSKDNIRYNKSLGGGALLDAGAYTLKATQFLFSGKWEIRSSFLKTPEGEEVDIYGGAFLINKEAGIFSEVAFGFDNFYQCSYEIWGSKGKLTAHRAFTPGPNFKPTVTIEKQGEKQDYVLDQDNHFINILIAFCNAIEDEKYLSNHDELMQQATLIQNTFQYAN
jgi:hypothetical protein